MANMMLIKGRRLDWRWRKWVHDRNKNINKAVKL